MAEWARLLLNNSLVAALAEALALALIAKAAFAAEDGSEVQVLAAVPALALVSVGVPLGLAARASVQGLAESWQVASCHLPAVDWHLAGLVSRAVSLGSAARASVEWLAELWQVASYHLPVADLCLVSSVCLVRAVSSHSAVWARASLSAEWVSLV